MKTVALILAMPVYAKAIRGIKTSIEVEDNGKLDEIELSDN